MVISAARVPLLHQMRAFSVRFALFPRLLLLLFFCFHLHNFNFFAAILWYFRSMLGENEFTRMFSLNKFKCILGQRLFSLPYQIHAMVCNFICNNLFRKFDICGVILICK